MKNVLWCSTVILSMWLFSGCSFNLVTPESLIEAPQSTQEQVQQRQMITSFLNHEEILVTPTGTTTNRAYVMEDLNNDGVDEIIAFYRNKDSNFILGFMILSQNDGAWELSHKVVAYGTGIDYFQVTDLDRQGSLDLLFGVQTGFGSVKELYIYQVQEDELVELTHEERLSYEQILLAEPREGMPFLISAVTDTSSLEGSSTIAMHRLIANRLQTIDVQNFAGYCNGLSYANVSRNEQGLMATMRHNHFTNILILTETENGFMVRLEEPLLYDDEDMQSLEIFGDTNNDGVIEVCSLWMPEENNTTKNYRDYIRIWMQWDGQESLLAISAVLENSNDGYTFSLPADWIEPLYYNFYNDGNVSWTEFFTVNEQGEQQEVFAFAAVDQLLWENVLDQEKLFILGNSPGRNKVYIAKIMEDKSDQIAVDRGKLISCLNIDGGR